MSKDLYLFGSLDDELSNFLIKEIFEAPLNKIKTINIFINSGGGSLVNALALYNAIKISELNINTFCVGRAASAASIVMISGKKRTMTENSYLMFHDLSLESSGKLNKIEQEFNHVKKLKDNMCNIIEKNSKLKKTTIEEKITSDWWIDSIEALELNLIDEVKKL